MLVPVTLPLSPLSHPPLTLYVPAKGKFPVNVTTCPFREVDVKEALLADTVPFKPMMVS
jgi:hypothetical protein